jgi:hypothetical protein
MRVLSTSVERAPAAVRERFARVQRAPAARSVAGRTAARCEAVPAALPCNRRTALAGAVALGAALLRVERAVAGPAFGAPQSLLSRRLRAHAAGATVAGRLCLLHAHARQHGLPRCSQCMNADALLSGDARRGW